jgi:hypothetical protein
MEYFIGNWGHNKHGGVEMKQFADTNLGVSFNERQHQLRVRNKGLSPIHTLILTHKKGDFPVGRTVSSNADGFTISIANVTTVFNQYMGKILEDGELVTLMAFDGHKVEHEELAISGGPAEIVINSETSLTITVHGRAGKRTLSIPHPAPVTGKEWVDDEGRVQPVDYAVYEIKYSGKEPLEITLEFKEPPAIDSAVTFSVGELILVATILVVLI